MNIALDGGVITQVYRADFVLAARASAQVRATRRGSGFHLRGKELLGEQLVGDGLNPLHP